MNRSSLITFLIIVVVLSGAGFYTYYLQTRSTSEKDSPAAKALSNDNSEKVFTDLDGNSVNLSDYEGRVRVVNTWATWCPFCTAELSDFGKLATENDKEKVVVIAINRAEPQLKAQAYISRLTGVDDVIFIQDINDSLYSAIGGFAMPETVFYRADGSIAVHKRGFMEFEEMRTHLNKALTPQEE